MFLFLHKIARIVERATALDSPLTTQDAQALWNFVRPYVCVIHEPTGRGYYLDRNYCFVISVQDIPRPGIRVPKVSELLTRVVPHETEQRYQAASSSTPEWAENLPCDEFSTYWLY